MEGQSLSGQLPAIQAVISSVGLFQDYETGSGNPAGVGTPSDYLHRRYSGHGRDRVTAKRSHHSCENLGFVINHPKSELTPTLEIEFLGFTVNSIEMELKLPGEKVKKIKSETGNALQSHTLSALVLSRIIRKMDVANQAIPMAPIYYRNLQACPREAQQEDENYSSVIVLTEEAKKELEWWRDHFTQCNGQHLITHNSSLTI